MPRLRLPALLFLAASLLASCDLFFGSLFSSDRSLSSLSVSSSTLSPAFSSATLNYSVTVESIVSVLTITATARDASAVVSINGGFGSMATVNLNPGLNTVPIVVTAEDFTSQTYTLSITRESPSVPVLSGESVSTTTDLNLPIPDSDTDNGVASQLFMTSAPTSLTAVEVQVWIDHTYAGDIELWLESPEGTRVKLADDNGSSGDNFTGTLFSDSAETSINQGSAPFTGRFRPLSLLSAFNGQDGNGTWTLQVYDDDFSDVGTLVRWGLALSGTLGPAALNPSTQVLVNGFISTGDRGVVVAADGDTVWLAYQELSGTQARLMMTRSQDEGETWETPFIVDDTGDTGHNLSMTALNGVAYLSYSRADGNKELYWAEASATGSVSPHMLLWARNKITATTITATENQGAVYLALAFLDHLYDTDDRLGVYVSLNGGGAWENPYWLFDEATASVAVGKDDLGLAFGPAGQLFLSANIDFNLHLYRLDLNLAAPSSEPGITPVSVLDTAPDARFRYAQNSRLLSSDGYLFVWTHDYGQNTYRAYAYGALSSSPSWGLRGTQADGGAFGAGNGLTRLGTQLIASYRFDNGQRDVAAVGTWNGTDWNRTDLSSFSATYAVGLASGARYAFAAFIDRPDETYNAATDRLIVARSSADGLTWNSVP